MRVRHSHVRNASQSSPSVSNEYARNPIIRVLAVIVAVAAGIRLIFWLLAPVIPWLLAVLAVAVVCKVVGWYSSYRAFRTFRLNSGSSSTA